MLIITSVIILSKTRRFAYVAFITILIVVFLSGLSGVRNADNGEEENSHPDRSICPLLKRFARFLEPLEATVHSGCIRAYMNDRIQGHQCFRSAG